MLPGQNADTNTSMELCGGELRNFSDVCNTTMFPTFLSSNSSTNETKTSKLLLTEQAEDAVIYITVVIVFYGVIIMLLIFFNLHRFKEELYHETNAYGEFYRRRELLANAEARIRAIQTSSRSFHIFNPYERLPNSIV